MFDRLFEILSRLIPDPVEDGPRSLLVVLAGLFVSGGFFVASLTINPLDFQRVQKANEFQVGSVLYGRNQDGEFEPVAEYYQFHRKLLPAGFIVKNPDSKVARAFVAMEDFNFYEHPGFDIKGITRAFFVNLMAGRIKEGASTITQQVARLKFLSQERSYVRKIKEAWLAVLLEFWYSKNEILEIYLNEVPLGHGNRGVVAASEFYFGKSYDQLEWGEAAVLASLTTAPNHYSPLKNMELSRQKTRVVFRRLVEMGVLSLAEARSEWQKLEDYYQNLNRSPRESAFSNRLNRFPWYSEYIRRIIKKRYGRRALYTGGLQIYTGMDIAMQKAAQEVIAEGTRKQTRRVGRRPFRHFGAFDDYYGRPWHLLTNLFGLPPVKAKMTREERRFDRHFQKRIRDELAVLNHLTGSAGVGDAINYHYRFGQDIEEVMNVEGALVTLEVDTGYITALVGGSQFSSDNQLIRAIDAYRQPGSSFKSLVYASAIEYSHLNPQTENPVTAATIFNDTPKLYLETNGTLWEPQNYTYSFKGFMRLRRALELSVNLVAVQVPEYVGYGNIAPIIEDIIRVEGRRRGPTSLPQGDLSIALGTFALSPLEMARAYSVFPARGRDVKPVSIIKITDARGNLIYEHKPPATQPKQILSEGTAAIMTSMLTGVVQRGTGRGARIGRPAAGKTGTTDNLRDAWFVGFTPGYVSALWMGFDRANISVKGSGGGLAAPLWGKYMRRAMRHKKVRSFRFPQAGIVGKKICKVSSTGEQYTELFHANMVPQESCESDLEKGPSFEEIAPGIKTGPGKSPVLEQKETEDDLLGDDSLN